MHLLFKGLCTTFLLSLFVSGQADENPIQASPPHQLIQQKTDALIDLIKQAKTDSSGKKGYYYTNPDRYFKELNNLIGPIVDFPSFTRGVMGQYGTRDYYNSLSSPQAKEAFKKNYARFIKEFRSGLINTYGKGLITFSGQIVKVHPPAQTDWPLIKQGKMVDVVQTISDKSKTHEVIFKLRPNKQKQWTLRNIIINNINLGDLYKKQFAAAMKKYDGDFGKVIDNWLIEISSEQKNRK